MGTEAQGEGRGSPSREQLRLYSPEGGLNTAMVISVVLVN